MHATHSRQNTPEPQETQNDAAADAAGASAEAHTSHPAVKLFALIGLTAILFAGAWFSVKLVQWLPGISSAASTFTLREVLPFPFGNGEGARKGALRLTLPSLSVAHGAPFTLSWEYPGTPEGAPLYALSYTCAEGVSLSVVDGLTIRDLPCGTPYRFSSESRKMLLVPRSLKNRFIDVTLSLVLLRADGTPREDTRATQIITIVNERISDSPSLRSPKKGQRAPGQGSTGDTNAPEAVSRTEDAVRAAPQTRAPQKPVTVFVPNPKTRENPSGAPDLAVEALTVGASVTVNGKDIFVPRTTIAGSATPTISFRVSNQGDKRSGSAWRFRLTIPLKGGQTFTYTSPAQEVLKPGDYIEYTVGLEELEAGSYTATVTLLKVAGDKKDANNRAEVSWKVVSSAQGKDKNNS